MKTKQITLYVYWNQYDWEAEGKFQYKDFKCSSDTEDCFFIKEIIVEVPDEDMPTRQDTAQLKVGALRAKADGIKAETHMQLKKIEDRIQQLLCLPMS